MWYWKGGITSKYYTRTLLGSTSITRISTRNRIINEVNWNILVTSGKEIKRDSMSNVNESREAYKKSK